MKIFWIILGVTIAALIGIFVYASQHNKPATNNTSTASASQVLTVTSSDHVQGNQNAPITLIEYGDFECPYCGEFYPIVKQVQANFGSKLRLVFREFPLSTIHPNAFPAARAAEAAGLQGKFWQMHDTLYQDQNQWANSTDALSYFKQYAGTLGLNVSKFDSDYNSQTVTDIVNNYIAGGNTLGVDATPTYYVNGKKIQPSSISVQALTNAINNAAKS